MQIFFIFTLSNTLNNNEQLKVRFMISFCYMHQYDLRYMMLVQGLVEIL